MQILQQGERFQRKNLFLRSQVRHNISQILCQDPTYRIVFPILRLFIILVTSGIVDPFTVFLKEKQFHGSNIFLPHLISRFFAFDPTPVSGKIPVEIRTPLPRRQFVYDFFVFLKLSRDKFGNRRKWILYQLTSYRSEIFKIYGINSGHGGARQNRIVTA